MLKINNIKPPPPLYHDRDIIVQWVILSSAHLSLSSFLTATFGSRLFASSLTDSSLFDCRALAQNGSYRKKNLHHYSEELTLQSEGNCGWFSTCCTFKVTAPLRFLVYLTGALISGCFCTCPLNLSEWRFQPGTLLSNWKNVFFEWPHLPLSPHNRILLSGTTGIRSYGDM